MNKGVRIMHVVCITSMLVCGMLGSLEVRAEDTDIINDSTEVSNTPITVDKTGEGIQYISSDFVLDENQADFRKLMVKMKNYFNKDGEYVGEYKDVEFEDVEPFICNGRTYIPIRGLAEQMGYNVKWSGGPKQVDIEAEQQLSGDGESLPIQCEVMYNMLAKHCIDGGQANDVVEGGSFGTTYFYFNMKKTDLAGLAEFRNRVVNSGSVRYGAYLKLGNKKGVSYVAKQDTYGMDEARVEFTMDDSCPLLYKNRTLLPLRAVGQMLGFESQWDQQNGIIYMNGESNAYIN